MSEVRHRWRKPIAQRFNPPSYGAVPPIAEREREREVVTLSAATQQFDRICRKKQRGVRLHAENPHQE